MSKIPASLAALALLAALAACSPTAEQAPPERPVQTIVLDAGTRSSFRSFPGEISATQSIDLSFDVPGRIIEFPATQGLVVSSGDLLGALDPERFETDLAAATARFNSASATLARHRQLRESGAISESAFEASLREYEVTAADQQAARRALDDSRLTAPFDGRVARTMVNNGENVAASQPVLVFQNLSVLEIDIQVPEGDMLVAQRGITSENARELLEVQAEFPSLPGRRFDLDLKSFSTEATQAARTFQVTFYFQPPNEHNILPGMTCTVLARRRLAEEPAEEGVFLVPSGAVVTAEGQTWIWKVDPETMEVSRHQIEMLAMEGNMIQIRGDALLKGDELVSSGARFLAQGMRVRRMR